MTLQEAVEHTLQTNPEVRAAVHELQARGHEVRQARAAYLPSVDVDAGYGQEVRNAPATGNEDVDLQRRELGLSAEQMLFDGFAATTEVNRQKARVESAQFELAALSEELALRTARVYLAVLRHAELLDLARQTLWEHQNIHDQMQLRLKTGTGSKADFDQIEARLALANANMIVAQNNFADAQSAFHRVTGLYPTLESMSVPASLATLPESRQLALDQALVQHPVLLGAKADTEAARQQYKAAASNYYPRITLEADKRWDDNIGGIEGNDEDLIVAVRLRYNLFSGGADRARRKQTAALVEESKDVRNNSRRQIIESLNLSWNAYDALNAQYAFLQKHVSAAEATKEAYREQFNIGRRTLLDLLNTENEVTESRKALINANIDRILAHYRILSAMGTLVESL